MEVERVKQMEATNKLLMVRVETDGVGERVRHANTVYRTLKAWHHSLLDSQPTKSSANLKPENGDI